MRVVCRTAVSVADQQQDSEVTALRAVITLANATLPDLINATIAANYTAQLSQLDADNSNDPSDVRPYPPALLLSSVNHGEDFTPTGLALCTVYYGLWLKHLLRYIRPCCPASAVWRHCHAHRWNMRMSISQESALCSVYLSIFGAVTPHSYC